MNKLINNLVNKPLTITDEPKFIHQSGICKSGKLIYSGCNNPRNVFNGRCMCYSTHAEMDVICKILKGQARTTI
jgi:hypothetical protein